MLFSICQLHTAATLNKHVQLLHPSSKNDIRAGTKCQVTGWGATDPHLLRNSDTLHEVTVTVINRKLCNSPSYYNHNPIITEDMICAGDARGQKDSCQVRAHQSTRHLKPCVACSSDSTCSLAQTRGMESRNQDFREFLSIPALSSLFFLIYQCE